MPRCRQKTAYKRKRDRLCKCLCGEVIDYPRCFGECLACRTVIDAYGGSRGETCGSSHKVPGHEERMAEYTRRAEQNLPLFGRMT